MIAARSALQRSGGSGRVTPSHGCPGRTSRDGPKPHRRCETPASTLRGSTPIPSDTRITPTPLSGILCTNPPSPLSKAREKNFAAPSLWQPPPSSASGPVRYWG